ncbi:substrate-binding domain-containing protein [Salinicola halophilus]|uniref:substrate-binding domain-containing protein n=1 Tax=Salinicola halophilus TaxID=184065 RepID=UPI000DA12097|nr:substrate-binding domain-containing protein [Salinicola halophilus]
MNRIMKTAAVVGILGASVAQAQAQQQQMRIVGSSTVYPFATYVVEQFGATTQHPTPVLESTGSGGGIKLFCEGVGAETPSITNASRRMKAEEFERCQSNGVEEITEATIGYDGIVFAESGGNESLNLNREQLFLALAAQVPQDGELVDNPYQNWSDIDESLPDRKIEVYGPPTTSGTRDAFAELVMEAASEEMDAYDGSYSDIRSDGAYIDAGENDNLIVQRLQENTAAFGIFGYSFLEENPDMLTAATIEGEEPTPDAISSGDYPVSRSLFFYVKNAHRDSVDSLDPYVDLFMSEQMIGPGGYLSNIGLIALPDDMRESEREQVTSFTPIEMSDLQEG